MTDFTYRAVQADGNITEGVISAGNRKEAIRRMELMGINPVRVAEKITAESEERAASSLDLLHRKVSSRDLENFTRQLSSLLSAGVPLSRALNIIRRETASEKAREKWKEIYELVIDGSSLADAMKKSPDCFSGVYVAMVKAGETGGFLELVLGQIADFQSVERDLKSRTMSALIYPAVLMSLAIGVLIFLLVFFIPRFKTIFTGFGATLPWITRAIVATSEYLTQYGPFLMILGVVLVLVGKKWAQSDRGRRTWQRQLLRLPVLGNLIAQFAMTRFCRMLGTLTGAGVPLINGLRVARESIGNQTLSDAVSTAIDRVRRGDSLADSLSGCRELFPGSVIEMIAVAEESGRLEQELLRLAEETEKELDRRLRTAVALTEPLMLFFMAGFVGIIFVGMVIPIFTLQDYIR